MIENKSDEHFEDDPVYCLLRAGTENARSMKDISSITGLTPRDVRAEMLRLRLQGALIAGDENGYFVPERDAEIKAAYKRSRARTLTGLRALEPLKSELRRRGYVFVDGQPVKDDRQVTLDLSDDMDAN